MDTSNPVNLSRLAGIVFAYTFMGIVGFSVIAAWLKLFVFDWLLPGLLPTLFGACR